MIAILGRDNDAPVPDQTIEIITRNSANSWNSNPTQKLIFPSSKGLKIKNMVSCTASQDNDLHFLAIIMNNTNLNSELIKINKLVNDKLVLY